jgi:hypothetical protein
MSASTLDILAGLTGAAVAVTDLMRTAQALGREVTDAELDATIAASLGKHERARQMVAVALERERGAPPAPAG